MFEFFNTLAENLSILKGELQYRMQIFYAAVNNFDFDGKIYQICFYSNRAKELIHKQCLYAYKNSIVVQYIVDNLNYSFNYGIRYAVRRRIEPMSPSWSCVSALIKSYYNYKDFAYNYNELYEFENAQTFADLYDTVRIVVDNEKTVSECLITFRADEKYIHRIYNSNKLGDLSEITVEQSGVKFLSIEYHSCHHPEPIVLEIGKNEYLINNEILSAAYIKRALEYQIPFHKFNENYSVFIMDNNLKTVSLRFGEYVKLLENSYTVMNETGPREKNQTNRMNNEKTI